MFVSLFSKVFCKENQRGFDATPPPNPALDEKKTADLPESSSSTSDSSRGFFGLLNTTRKNVGTMEELHKKCKGLFSVAANITFDR